VIGTGDLGLRHAVCMAELGHDVLAIDVDPAKVTKAASGEPPFFEPGLGFRACVLRERVQTEAEAV
jgi:UDPglucose 6-dehydrogenase